MPEAKEPATRPAEILATLERTKCFGHCPAYRVTVFEDGSVAYEGVAYVKTVGRETWKIGPDAVLVLEDAFQEAKFFDMRDFYASGWTDMPSAKTSFRRSGLVKIVDHELGPRNEPQALVRLEEFFDEIVGIEKWIGTREERLLLHR